MAAQKHNSNVRFLLISNHEKYNRNIHDCKPHEFRACGWMQIVKHTILPNGKKLSETRHVPVFRVGEKREMLTRTEVAEWHK